TLVADDHRIPLGRERMRKMLLQLRRRKARRIREIRRRRKAHRARADRAARSLAEGVLPDADATTRLLRAVHRSVRRFHKRRRLARRPRKCRYSDRELQAL